MTSFAEPSFSARHAAITLALCALVAAFEGADLQAAGVVMPHIAPLFHFVVSEKKWFLAAGTIGLVIGALIGGRIADLWGRKVALMISVAVFGVCSVTTALAATKSGLIEARLATGIGLGGALPNLIALTAEATRALHRRRAVAVMYCGMPFGGGCISLLSLAGATGGSWQDVFYVGGLAPVALLPLLWFWLPDSAEFQAAKLGSARPPVLASLFGAGLAVRTLLLWTSFFTGLLVLYLLLNWLPSLMVARGLSEADAAWIQVAFNLAAAAGALAAGAALGRAATLAVLLFFGGAIAGVALLALVPATLFAELIASSVVGAAVVGAQSILLALAPGFYPTTVRGTGVGSAVSAGRLGSVAGPLVAGLILQGGGNAVSVLFYLIPVAAVSMAAATMLIRK